MATDRSMVEFDSWIICPKCHNAMVGEVGEECFLCGVECVATPLYGPEFTKIIGESEPILAELGIEYDSEELEVLDELGL